MPALAACTPPTPASADTRWCHVKRFSERWHADDEFRQAMPADPPGALARWGLAVDAEDVRPIWDGSLLARRLDGTLRESDLPDALREYRDHIAGLVRWRTSLFEAAVPTEPRWREWRQRQMARARSEMGAMWTRSIVFSTAAYELSRGCSVGCWFCGVAAPKLTDHFRHTPDNAALFRDVLECVASFSGVGGLWSHFLYWASDPFDNPDYERHCEDFFQLAGRYPAVTTALALRNPERMRAWLRLAPRKGLPVTRFSVVTLPMLDRLHRTFSAEEMASVECVLLNKESNVSKANAGRFRERAGQDPELLAHELRKLQPVGAAAVEDMLGFGPTTIACVSGFLFNLVERSVRLISPCKASQRWPLGYMVFGEGRFDTRSELQALLAHLIDDGMALTIDARACLRFREDVTYEHEPHGFRAWTCHGGARFVRPDLPGYYTDLGDLVAAGDSTPADIAERLFARHAVFPGDTQAALHAIFQRGLLADEPRLPAPGPSPTAA